MAGLECGKEEEEDRGRGTGQKLDEFRGCDYGETRGRRGVLLFSDKWPVGSCENRVDKVFKGRGRNREELMSVLCTELSHSTCPARHCHGATVQK